MPAQERVQVVLAHEAEHALRGAEGGFVGEH